MKNIYLLSFCCLLFPFFIPSKTISAQDTSEFTFHTQQQDITVLFNELVFPWSISEDRLNFPYAEKGSKIRFASLEDTLSFHLLPKTESSIRFIINRTDTVVAIAVGLAKPVTFDEEYIQQNTGTYQVFCPEVHELVNISMALTHIGQQDSNMMNMETEYYQRVRSHFDAYSDHTLIDSLNQMLTEVFGEETYNNYYSLKMDACMYSFTEDGKIVNESPYNKLGFGSEDPVAKLSSLFESFAKESNFATFYETERPYYQSLVDDYYSKVPIKKMWAWVEKKFPQRYQAYKIYFSPLVQGAHATQNYADNGYKETVMFINAPIFTQKFEEKEIESILSRIVFTEIDHNYVNPTSDTYTQVSTVMNPLTCWNNGAHGYQSSYATFNEYMTYAVFALYLFEHFDSSMFEKRNKIDSDMMENSRGFSKYGAFNAFVLDWYKSHRQAPLDKLYPEVLTWIATQNCE